MCIYIYIERENMYLLLFTCLFIMYVWLARIAGAHHRPAGARPPSRANRSGRGPSHNRTVSAVRATEVRAYDDRA